MRTPMPDRRRCPRIPMRCAAKLYDPKARRYRPAQTVNASRHGLLLEVRRGLRGERGEDLELLIDWFGAAGVAPRGELRAVRVARVEPERPGEPFQRIAVTYADRRAARRAA